MNSLRHEHWKVSPYEIFKNRIQCDVEPVRFYPVGLERKLVNEKFSEKVRNILKSKLKVVLPVYKKGDVVKVDIPNELTRFGVVTSTKDHWAKSAVLIKFPNQRPFGVHKNNICVPRNASAAVAPNSSSTSEIAAPVSVSENTEPPVSVSSPNILTSVPAVQNVNEENVSSRTRSRI